MQQQSEEKYVIALGFFDGVHLGHAQLINMAKKRASEIGAKPAVLSFDTSPMSIVTGKSIPLIADIHTREETIHKLFGVERVIIYHFDKAVMTMPWEDFINSLIDEFSALHFVVGHDFSCGYKGQGTAEKIRAFCTERGLGCDVIPEFKLDGITVSSTYIRELISSGNISEANRFLGHPYSVSGSVEDGRKVGRKLGTPTINLTLSSDMALPAHGVYATAVRLGQSVFKAVTNVGLRPTFGESDKLTVESYILDFSEEVYGERVSVEFYEFLRPERKFADAAALSKQIKSDAERARTALSFI